MASPQRTPEFRAEAVRIALTSGLSRRQVASDLGVGFSTLHTWVRQYQGSASIKRTPRILRFSPSLNESLLNFAVKTDSFGRRGTC